jgi:hypothetical protein
MSENPMQETEESVSSPVETPLEEVSDDLPITPEKDEAQQEETPNNAEKPDCVQTQDGLVAPKPKIGPRSKMKNGGGPETLPDEINMESAANPIAATEPKKHRPGPKSKRTDTSQSDSLNMGKYLIRFVERLKEKVK